MIREKFPDAKITEGSSPRRRRPIPVPKPEEPEGPWSAPEERLTRDPADVAREKAAHEMKQAKAESPGAVAEAIAAFTTTSTTEELAAFVGVLVDTGDLVGLDRAKAAWTKDGLMGAATFNDLRREAERTRPQAETISAAPTLDAFTTHHRRLVDHARWALAELNKRPPHPTLYLHADRLAEVRRDAVGTARIVAVDGPQGLAAIANRMGLFHRVRGEGKKAVNVQVACPLDVARDLWADPDPLSFALPLSGLRTAPFYTDAGSLVARGGYDPESQIVLAMGPELSKAMTRVSAPGWSPTAEEAREATLFLVEELAADFPLDGLNRAGIMDAVREGRPVPSVAALIGLLVLPFVRSMIEGPTPGHLLTKPAPGTGASLLADMVSNIVVGEDASALTFPRSAEEVGKVLASIMREGAELAYFDNLSAMVEGAEMASALTARRYKARVLGSTATLDVAVRCTFILTGNMVTASPELSRRLVPLALDARTPDPTARSGWRHADLLGFVRENRGRAVVAILTIIKRWLDLGQPAPSCPPLASFESWTRVVGGVVEHGAGLAGFMGNRAAWLGEAVEEDGVERLVAALAGAGDGATIRVRTRKAGEGHVSLLDVLRELGDATEAESPLALKGWGFEAVEDRDGTSYRYGKAAVVGRQFGKAARKPWAVKVGDLDVVVSFEERVASDNSKCWTMGIKAR
jgi:hypothetical protein